MMLISLANIVGIILDWFIP